MIVALQIISKVLATKDYSLIEDNLLTPEYFIGYENEAQFIIDHYNEFKVVPDEISFLDKFPKFDLQEVTDSDEYLIYKIREEEQFLRLKDALEESAKLLEEDSNKAAEYLLSRLGTDIQPQYRFSDEEIIESTQQRVKDSEYRNQNPTEWFIPTGFSEIDDDISGMQRGDELFVLFARTNMGKSWIAEAIATNCAELGYRAGYFSPEMSVQSIGYRFDTLHGNVPNTTVVLGRFDDNYTLEQYNEYAKTVEKMTGKLYVTKPKDFQRKVTVSKLRNWIKERKLDLLVVDGIKYLSDERYKRGDSVTISLTNISEDLMDLSSEMRIPIVVVVQANRGGVVDKNSLDTPELENIRDSDGIAQNASVVFAIRQLKDTIGDTYAIIENKKMRNGAVGKSYKYKWDINLGKFESVDDINMDNEEDNYTERKEPTASSEKRKREVEDEF